MGKDFNADESVEAIKVQIDGKTYQVSELSEDLIQGVTDVAEAFQGSEKKDVKVLSKQLAMLVGAEPEVFKNTDIRKLANAVEYIMKEVIGTREEPVKKD